MSQSRATNDILRDALKDHHGFTLDEKIRSYLLSLGYSGPTTQMLSQFSYNGKRGWNALVEMICVDGVVYDEES